MPRSKEVSPALAALRGIDSREALAIKLGVSWERIRYLLFRAKPGERYRTFEIKKKKGGVRVISAPTPSLKGIQRVVATLLLEIYSPKAPVHGFVENRNVATNAMQHKRRRLVLNVDLKDFFPSVHLGRVRGLFQKEPYLLSKGVATLLAQICCHEGKLPQGAPTSPIISNMICARLDGELLRLAKANHATYSRYADDLTFSTNSEVLPRAFGSVIDHNKGLVNLAGSALSKIISDNVFQINPEKVRLLTRKHSQMVTGVKVNSILNVRRTYVRNVRAMIHDWRKNGYNAAEAKHLAKRALTGGAKAEFRRVIHGKLAYLRMIKGPRDLVYQSLYQAADKLETRDQVYWRRGTEPKIFRVRESSVPQALGFLEHGVWVIETESAGDQGTAFGIGDNFLLTCAHCVKADSVLVNPRDQRKRYPLKMVFDIPESDWAVVAVADAEPNVQALQLRSGSVGIDSHVIIAGYPDFGPGSSLSIKRGRVIALQRRFGHEIYMVDCAIYPGNSGGPVLNEDGEVIGIAARGPRSDEVDSAQMNWVIPLFTIAPFLPNREKIF